jgi:O-succinylbenzoic acid--CoA ligase
VDDGLCILGAARDAGAAPALRIGARSHRFDELAARVRERLDAPDLRRRDAAPIPLVATSTLQTVVTLYALLQAGVPALLLHPRQTAHEHERVLQAARAASPAWPDGAAAVLWTSGTTGAPRGVVLTRRALLASAQASAANMGWQDDDCWLLAMPLARVGGLSILTRCLAARRCVALAEAFDARQLPRWVEEQQVTLLSLVPTMLAQCLDAHPHWVPPPTLRAIQLGGAAASPRLLQRAAERGLPIIVTYGCTETSSQVVTTPYAARFEAARHGAGRALPGVQLRIADHGRIQVRGPMLMAGYLGEPPLAPDAWFDTGDRGEIVDGDLIVHGRGAELIVTGGENVFPAEVERELEACPGIAAAGVFGLPDETWGQIVCAWLVADGEPPSDAALGAHLARRLAGYKRPRRIGFVPALPHTPAGKPDRAALPTLPATLRALPRPA